jgi:serine protease
MRSSRRTRAASRLVVATGGLALLGGVAGTAHGAPAVAVRAEAAEHAAHLDFMPTVEQARRMQHDCVLPVEITVTCIGEGTPVVYNGANVQTAPRVYIVFWGWTGDPSGQATYQENFFNNLGGSSWFGSQTQYCQSTSLTTLVSCGPGDAHVGNPTGMLLGTWSDSTNAVPTHPADADIQAEAQRAAAHFGNTTVAGNANVQYVIDTPHGNSTTGFGTQWCSYHGASFSSSMGGDVYYTDFPYMTDAGASCGANFVSSALDGVSIVGGHEFAETATDPVPGHGWTDALGQETGDKCAWISVGQGAVGDNVNGDAVQSLWSNQANDGLGGCVPA